MDVVQLPKAAEPLQAESLPFTIGGPGTHLINLRRWKG